MSTLRLQVDRSEAAPRAMSALPFHSVEYAEEDQSTEAAAGGSVMLTCSHCGHEGEDVAEDLVYEGGHGYVWRDLCADRVRCWDRWQKEANRKEEQAA